MFLNGVATVLTVYGIETFMNDLILFKSFMLQQFLPFTVLKLNIGKSHPTNDLLKLQQFLPFTVLKPRQNSFVILFL